MRALWPNVVARKKGYYRYTKLEQLVRREAVAPAIASPGWPGYTYLSRKTNGAKMRTARVLARLLLMFSAYTVSPENMFAQAIPSELGDLRHSRTLGGETTFGRVTAASALPGGFFAVLDGMETRVTLFGGDGEVLGVRGRRGRGPREFASPVALAVRGDGILVLDRGNLRIVELAMDADSIAWLSEIEVPIPNPTDMCTVGDRLFILGFARDRIVHEVNRAGQITRSFGAAASDDPTGGSLTAAGALACSPSGWIAVLTDVLNYVAVFSVDGNELWRGQIPQFRRQEYDMDGGMMRPLPPSDGYLNSIASAWVSGEDFLEIQLGRHPSDPADIGLESRRLNVLTGSWLPTTRRWPRVMVKAGGTYMFYEENPFPLLKIYR